MNDNIFFSIICPTYNSAKFIQRNINSLIRQNYKNFEVIYSDDGSTDETTNIILKNKKKFFDKKIQFSLLKNNHRGPGAARNFAIKSSKYEWISFLDSDDEWDSSKLAKVETAIKNNPTSNCIAHNELFKKKDNSIEEYNYSKYFDSKQLIYHQLFNKNFLSTSSITLKKELIIKANYFDETLMNAQDYDMWLKIGDNFKLFFIDEFLGSYYERDGNITSTPYKKKIFNLLKILKKNKNSVSIFQYYYKFLRILINREWFK